MQKVKFYVLGVCLCFLTLSTAAQRVFVLDSVFGYEEGLNEYLWYKQGAAVDFEPAKGLAGFTENTRAIGAYFGEGMPDKPYLSLIKLYNNSEKERALILVGNHQRLDGLKGYIVKDDSLIALGTVHREMPLKDRPILSNDLVLPLTIAAHDTIQVLLETSRNTGIHELPLGLMDAELYYIDLRERLLYLIVLVGFFMTIGLVLIIRSMVYRRADIFLAGMAIIFFIVWILVIDRYLDRLTFPLGLSSSNLSVFTAHLFYGSVLCFGLCHFKYRKVKLYRFFLWLFWVLVFLNVIMLLLLFTPQPYYQQINILIATSFGIIVLLSQAAFIGLLVVYVIKVPSGRFFIFLCSIPLLVLVGINVFPHIEALNIDLQGGGSYLVVLLMALVLLYAIVYEFNSDLIAKTKIEKELNEQQKKSGSLLNMQVESIGRTLHDVLGNTLALALGLLDLKEVNKTDLKSILNQAVDETRMISHSLALDTDKSLSERVAILVERFNDYSGIFFNFIDESNGAFEQIEDVRKDGVFLMIQELVTNIVKHSGAKNAYIQLLDLNGTLEITVEDDGVGYDIEKIHEGMGLFNLRKRAEILQIKLTVDSSSFGTGVILEL